MLPGAFGMCAAVRQDTHLSPGRAIVFVGTVAIVGTLREASAASDVNARDVAGRGWFFRVRHSP